MPPNIGQELLNVPLPQMVQNLGSGIAEAQYALDKVSIQIARLMSGFREMPDGTVEKDESLLIKMEEGGKGYSLLSLGFTPTFYQFTNTEIEVKMAISTKQESEIGVSTSASGGIGLFSASVNASYSQKFQYSAEGSSLLKTKLVTVPTPMIFEERLRANMVEPEED